MLFRHIPRLTSSSSARNARQPEETGPFGRNRSLRTTGSRTPRARTGTTPVRQKENTAVAEFGRLFAKEQAKEEEHPKTTTSITPSGDTAPVEPESIPTECLLYGYAGKSSEWKVLSKFESIVTPGFICEDYPREDPNLFLSSNSPLGLTRSSVVVRENLSREAIRKSRIYSGGVHWIKVTFDSYQDAERACFYSPLEIDGYMVHCEMWQGRGPAADVALPKGPVGQENLTSGLLSAGDSGRKGKARTLSAATGAGKDSAIAGFERALQTLPRGHTMPDGQYGQPEDEESITSTTASSATATAMETEPLLSQQSTGAGGLRSRSVPNLPSHEITVQQPSRSEYMTHIKVKKAVLRPVSEALPPQPTFAERAVRSIPGVRLVVGSGTKQGGGSGTGTGTGTTGGFVGEEGPLVKDDGTWDPANGWYWSFWHRIDDCLGTDFCGIKDD